MSKKGSNPPPPKSGRPKPPPSPPPLSLTARLRMRKLTDDTFLIRLRHEAADRIGSLKAELESLKQRYAYKNKQVDHMLEMDKEKHTENTRLNDALTWINIRMEDIEGIDCHEDGEPGHPPAPATDIAVKVKARIEEVLGNG